MTQQENLSPILLVDDDEQLLMVLARTLQLAGYSDVATATSGSEACDILARREFSLAVLDLNLPDRSGRDIHAHILEHHPGTSVIFLSGASQVETVVDCMRLGACDYLVKPVEHSRFIATVKRTIELRSLREAVSSIEHTPPDERLKNESSFAPILTQDTEMRKLFRYLEVVAPTDHPVLITGETGVGKELFARAVHDVSGLKGNFVAINVAGLDDMVFADTLFGHRKGAYTGADHARNGLVATAACGTLFLDEIGDLKEQSQIKLLRLLQENEYYPIGADAPLKNRARIVLATNHDIEALVDRELFRKDLYYRIYTHRLHIPPLRSRAGDIPLLFARFVAEAAAAFGRKIPFSPPEIALLLAGYAFPGNVRELQAMAYNAVAHNASGKLSLESIEREMTLKKGAVVPSSVLSGEPGAIVFNHFPSLREAEEHLVAEALRRAGGNQGLAATMLGLTRQALNNRLRRSRS